MSSLYDKIVSERGTLESIASKIPGFRGYMEASGRREADRMIRDHVANLFKGLIDRVAQAERDMLMAPDGLMQMEKTKSIKTKLETLRRKIETDMPGYSGFFASNKITTEDYETIYAFDEAMVRYVDSIGEKIDAVMTSITSGDGLAASLQALDMMALEAQQAYDLRDDVLNGID